MAAAAAAAAEGAERARRSRASARSPWCRARTPRTSSRASWTSGTQQHPDQKVTLIELPEDADAQRQQMIQNANAKSDAYTRALRRQRLDRRVRRQPLHRPAARETSSPTRPSSCRRSSTRRSTRTSCTRIPVRLRRRHAVLPHRPAAGRRHRRPAQDVGRDDRRLQEDPGDAAGRGPQLLRRPVPEVRGPHGQRRRGHQQRGRRDHRRGRQARTSTPRRPRRASTSWSTASSRDTSPRRP